MKEGTSDGIWTGFKVGLNEGDIVGIDGLNEGRKLGTWEDIDDGAFDGLGDGYLDGEVLGIQEGLLVGLLVRIGTMVGALDGQLLCW